MDTNFLSSPIISLRDTATFQFVPLVLQVAESRNDYIWIVGNNFKHICVVIYLKPLLFQVIYCRYQFPGYLKTSVALLTTIGNNINLYRDLRYKKPIHNLIILDYGCVRSPLYQDSISLN